jgi:hypothetical protein
MPYVTGGYLQQSAHPVEHGYAVDKPGGVGLKEEDHHGVDEHAIDHQRRHQNQRVRQNLPLVDDEVRTLE